MTAATLTSATTSATSTKRTSCDPAGSVTRSLLGYGVLAGPVYVTASMAQALTRDGFDLSRHSWSLLANGPYGWVHVANFVVTGLMLIAGAAGLRRALRGERAATWAPRLLTVSGIATIMSGFLKADPALGFPIGTAVDEIAVSPQGAAHLGVGAVSFLCFVAATVALGRRFRAEGRQRWAAYSIGTGVSFLAAFVGIASSTPGTQVTTLVFVAAVVNTFAWVCAVSAHFYRRTWVAG